MKNKQILLLIAAGALAFSFFQKGSKKTYCLPNGMCVDESQLNSLGYQEVPVGSGNWYSQAQIDAAAAQAGATGNTVDPSSSVFNTILTILQGLQGLVPIVQVIVTAANRPQKIQEILNKYTDSSSAYFIPMFAYTQADLQALTNAQLTTILNTGIL